MIKKIPPHEHTLSICHNECRSYYENVQQYCENGDYIWASGADKAVAIALDSMWEVCVDNMRPAFAASTLDIALMLAGGELGDDDIPLPKYDVTLYLTHNPSHGHDTEHDYIEDYTDDWIGDKTEVYAMDKPDFWEITWYPNTPIGFYTVCCADLETLLMELPEDG